MKKTIFFVAGLIVGAVLGSVFVAQAATCTGPFFGGTGFCYATGSTGGIQAGSVPFGNGTSGLATSSNLFWDNTNFRLGIGSSTPWARLSVQDSSAAPLFAVASTTYGGAINTVFSISNRGGIHIATSTLDASRGIGFGIGTTTAIGSAQVASYFASSTCTGSCTVNWNQGNRQRFQLNQNLVLDVTSTSSNPIDGGGYMVELCQDAVGSRTLTFGNPVGLRWDATGTTTISSTANTCTDVGFIFHASGIYTAFTGPTGFLNQ